MYLRAPLSRLSLHKQQCERATLRRLGTYSRNVTTKKAKRSVTSTKAWRYFTVFNHAGAIRSFQEAARLDPRCAMAHWGVALAPVSHQLRTRAAAMAELAWKELLLAQQNAGNASEVERALIDASVNATHIRNEAASTRSSYADAMREVWKRFPNDVDVGALFAEAMMDLRPGINGQLTVNRMMARRNHRHA